MCFEWIIFAESRGQNRKNEIGLLEVINKINVLASDRSDTAIQRDLRLRFLDSLDPELQNITVHVADGRVTLSGRVDSESQRRRAGLIND